MVKAFSAEQQGWGCSGGGEGLIRYQTPQTPTIHLLLLGRPLSHPSVSPRGAFAPPTTTTELENKRKTGRQNAFTRMASSLSLSLPPPTQMAKSMNEAALICSAILLIFVLYVSLPAQPDARMRPLLFMQANPSRLRLHAHSGQKILQIFPSKTKLLKLKQT